MKKDVRILLVGAGKRVRLVVVSEFICLYFAALWSFSRCVRVHRSVMVLQSSEVLQSKHRESRLAFFGQC